MEIISKRKSIKMSRNILSIIRLRNIPVISDKFLVYSGDNIDKINSDLNHLSSTLESSVSFYVFIKGRNKKTFYPPYRKVFFIFAGEENEEYLAFCTIKKLAAKYPNGLILYCNKFSGEFENVHECGYLNYLEKNGIYWLRSSYILRLGKPEKNRDQTYYKDWLNRVV